mgnify:CR=1 FL=1
MSLPKFFICKCLTIQNEWNIIFPEYGGGQRGRREMCRVRKKNKG